MSHENTDSASEKSPIVTIVIDSFEAKIIKIKVFKKVDKMSEILLDETGDDKESVGAGASGLWGSIASSLGASKKEKEENENNLLNIFSVASGHLYERLLRYFFRDFYAFFLCFIFSFEFRLFFLRKELFASIR